MQEYKIIVIGASSGGVETLKEIFRGLKPDLRAAIFVVLHIPPDAKSYLDIILNKQSPIPVTQAHDGEKIAPGHAYTAAPDRHLIIQNGVIRLTYGPKENYTRPAVGPLFASAARYFGPRVIGVILSGNLSDGTKGLMRIKQAGGTAVVQAPEDALFPDMPLNALLYVKVDYRLPAAEIASVINRLSDQAVLTEGENLMSQTQPDFSDDDTELIKKDIESYELGDETNQRSVITCPECGGILWELKDGKLVRFRCHTGHVYYPEVLLASHDSELERNFWTSIRLLVEKAAISNRLAKNAKQENNQDLEAYYLAIAKEAENEAKRIRETWFHGKAKSSRSVSAGELANEDITRSAE